MPVVQRWHISCCLWFGVLCELLLLGLDLACQLLLGVLLWRVFCMCFEVCGFFELCFIAIFIIMIDAKYCFLLRMSYCLDGMQVKLLPSTYSTYILSSNTY